MDVLKLKKERKIKYVSSLITLTQTLVTFILTISFKTYQTKLLLMLLMRISIIVMGPNALPFEINCKHDIYLYNIYLHGVYMYVHVAQSVKKYASKPRIAHSNLAPILQ